jgi:hypothetical protein
MASERGRFAISIALLALGGLALLVPKLAPFLLVGCFIAYVAMPAGRPRAPALITLGAGALALVAFVRFLVVEAMPGIVEGGTRATQNAAISRLREMVFAEDSLRKTAEVDPDQDGVGSAALLGELTSALGLRGGAPLKTPRLERYPAAVATPSGPAIEMGGYLFMVCLPRQSGGFTAEAGVPIDEELAERRFLAYAWPAADERGLNKAYFVDEHERILVATTSSKGEATARLGPQHPPTCEEALAPRGPWREWRNKKPRQRLPGDRP